MTAQEAVANGVEWLDEKKPDWFMKVNTGLLDMHCCLMCVLGQACGDYHYALNDFIPEAKHKERNNWAQTHGFLSGGLAGPNGAALAEEWETVIEAKKKEVKKDAGF